MDLRFTPEELAFRDEVRTFMRTALPTDIRSKLVEGRRLKKDDLVVWQRILNAKGWAVPHWPAESGSSDTFSRTLDAFVYEALRVDSYNRRQETWLCKTSTQR